MKKIIAAALMVCFGLMWLFSDLDAATETRRILRITDSISNLNSFLNNLQIAIGNESAEDSQSNDLGYEALYYKDNSGNMYSAVVNGQNAELDSIRSTGAAIFFPNIDTDPEIYWKMVGTSDDNLTFTGQDMDGGENLSYWRFKISEDIAGHLDIYANLANGVRLQSNNGIRFGSIAAYTNIESDGDIDAPDITCDSIYADAASFAMLKLDTIEATVVRVDSFLSNNSPHLAAGFKDSSVTITISATTTDTQQITNASNTLWQFQDTEKFAGTNDTVQIIYPADYEVFGWIEFNGFNGGSYEIGIYNVTTGESMGFPSTTTFTSPQVVTAISPITIYLDNLSASDKLIMYVINKGGTQNLVLKSASIIMKFLHE